MKKVGSKRFGNELLFGIAITFLLFFIAAAVPVFSTFAAFLVPLPIFYYYSKLGRMQGVVIILVSLSFLCIAFWSLGISLTIPQFFLIGAIGPVLSEVVRKDYSIEKTIIYAIVILLILGGTLLFYFSIIMGKGPYVLITEYIYNIVHENIDLYSQIENSSQQISLIKDNADQIAKVFAHLFPSLVVVGTSIFVCINLFLGKQLFQKSGMWYPDYGDFSCWKVTDKLVWAVVLSGMLILISRESVRILGLNMLIVSLFVYLLQGLSVVSYFFKKRNIPFIFRVMGYFLIFAQRFLLLLVIGLGLIDVWADFRKLEKAEKENVT